MKKSTGLLVSASAALALSVLAPSEAHAQIAETNRFGLGLALGYPDVGLSASFFTTRGTSLQFVASFLYRDPYLSGCDRCVAVNSGLFLRADYLFHPNTFTRGSVAALGWYIGPGLNLGIGNDKYFSFGVELPIGLSLQFQRFPMELALEFVPRFNIVDNIGARFDFGSAGTFHIRWYF